MENRFNNLVFIGILGFLECLFPSRSWAASYEVTSCKGISLYYSENEGRKLTHDFCSRRNRIFYLNDTLVLQDLKSSRITFYCEHKDDSGNKTQKAYKFPTLGQTDPKIYIGKYCNTVDSRNSVDSLKGSDDVRIFLGGYDSQVPFIISPRTDVISERPQELRWNLVKKPDGVVKGSYAISLYREGCSEAIWYDDKPSYSIKNPGYEEGVLPIVSNESSVTKDSLESLSCTMFTQFPELKPLIPYWFSVKFVPNPGEKSVPSSGEVKSECNNQKWSDSLKQQAAISEGIKSSDGDLKNQQDQVQIQTFVRLDLQNLPTYLQQPQDGDIVSWAINLAEKGYFTKAIQILEAAKLETSQSYEVLGGLYAQIGLSSHMERTLREAIKLAEYKISAFHPENIFKRARNIREIRENFSHKGNAEQLLGRWRFAQVKREIAQNKRCILRCKEYITEGQRYLQDAMVSHSQANEPNLEKEVDDLLKRLEKEVDDLLKRAPQC